MAAVGSKGHFDVGRAQWSGAGPGSGTADGGTADGGTAGGGAIEVAFVDDLVGMRNAAQPHTVLVFTRDEWDAFVAGARLGEFDVPEPVE